MENQQLYLGETIGFWIQTGAIVFSALIAAFAIWHNGKMARRRTTVDVLLQENKDEKLREAKFAVFNMANKETTFVKLYFEGKEEQTNEYKQITMLLNRYEFIAQSIHNGAFEDKIYKQMQYNNIVNMWNRLRPLVYEIRNLQKCDTHYQEFEKLVDKWKKKPLKVYKK